MILGELSFAWTQSYFQSLSDIPVRIEFEGKDLGGWVVFECMYRERGQKSLCTRGSVYFCNLSGCTTRVLDRAESVRGLV